ncbi:glycosyltransferase family protein, partial [Flavobacterium oreochromis]
PIIIINFNQLFYLKKLVSFLKQRNFKNIVIIDNCSTYQPLLDYYDLVKKEVVIHLLSENLGHLALWKKRDLYNQYCNGFYVVTDADIVPNDVLGSNFIGDLINLLFKYSDKNKIGLALNINDIPDYYPLKSKVINWERKFWESEIEQNVFSADIDTTFALYWPKFDRLSQYLYPSFFNGIRVAGDFTCKHGGWYLNPKKLTEEQKYYFATANLSNSWKLNEQGDLIGDFINDYL